MSTIRPASESFIPSTVARNRVIRSAIGPAAALDKSWESRQTVAHRVAVTHTHGERMAGKKTGRKPQRVVFSLGCPLTLEERAVKNAARLKVTRNAYIVGALEDRVVRDEHVEKLQREAKRNVG